MYVKEFARRLGLPASKVRYYDRCGMYQSCRESNNYRNFTDTDALDAYLVQSLRSIDLTMEESLRTVRSEDRHWFHDSLSGRIEVLRAEIARAQDKLERLEQLRSYSAVDASRISGERAEPGRILQDQTTYSLRTFGSYTKVNNEVLKLTAALGRCMPYSYIALTIPEESLLAQEEDLLVGMGLGIREENMALCGLAPSPVMDCFPGGPYLALILEREDVFHLKRSDLLPLFELAGAKGLRIYGDATGRISSARNKNGRRCYSFSVCCHVEPL